MGFKFLLAAALCLFMASGTLSAQEVQFLEVPLDWHQPQNLANPVKMAYKILNSQDSHLPYLFVIGGGPGAPAIAEGLETLIAPYKNYFRVVLFDQRGVGQSLPFPQKNGVESILQVAQFFTAKSIAKDVGVLVRKLTKEQEGFFLMGNSYGGVVAYEYLQSESGPKPQAVVLGHPVPANLQPKDFIKERFINQINLSHRMLSGRPRLQEKITKLRSKLHDYSEQGSHILDTAVMWAFSSEESIKDFEDALDMFLEKEEVTAPIIIATIEKFLAVEGRNSLVHEVLSFLDISRGYSAFSVQKDFRDALAAQPDWVLTEARGHYFSTGTKFVEDVIRPNIAKYAWQVDTVKIREALNSTKLIYITGENDAAAPATEGKKDFEMIKTPNTYYFQVSNGNHHSVLAKDVVEKIIRLLKHSGCDSYFF